MSKIGTALITCALLLGCGKQDAPHSGSPSGEQGSPSGKQASPSAKQEPPRPKAEFEWTGKLDFVLTGFMGEYRMGDGAMLGTQGPALRVGAYLRDKGCVYQLRFVPETIFVGAAAEGEPAGLPVKRSADHPRLLLHSDSSYRVAGRFRKPTDAAPGAGDEVYFFPVDFQTYHLQLKSQPGFIMRGNGIPYQVDPEPARDLIVERLEVATPATTTSCSMHGAIRRTYVFDKVLVVGWKDPNTPSVAGTYNAPRKESWSVPTADTATVRTHLQAVAQQTTDKYLTKAIEKRLKELDER